MTPESVFTLTVIFSLVTGTAAGVLSLLTWEVLRHSPFGRAVFALSLVLVIFIIYHVLLLFLSETTILLQGIELAMLTSAAAFIWLMVWSQHRLRCRARRGVDP